MIEKVKLTREVAEVLIEMKERKKGVAFWSDDEIIREHVQEPHGWGINCPLNGIPLLKLVDALRIGYEVEPNYKVGDWVHDENTKATIHIKSQQHANNLMDERHVSIRFATPEEIKVEKERRVWAKIGREVGEFRDGDLSIGKDGFEYKTIRGMKAAYKERELTGFHPAESFIKFGGGEE